MTNPERVTQFLHRRLGWFVEQKGLVDAIVAYSIEHASAEVERHRETKSILDWAIVNPWTFAKLVDGCPDPRAAVLQMIREGK